MSLTQQDVEALRRKFQPQEHEFLQEFAYITEGAIANRIEEVDPSWSFEIISIYTRDNQAVVNARMTIKGVSRDGVGMQVIMEKGKSEPEKGAATDALKRCARLFGIGRYLLDLPGNVKDMASLSKWLNGGNSNNTATTSRFQQGNATTPQNAANGASNAISDAWDEPAVKTFIEHYSGRVTMAELMACLQVARFGEWKQGGVAAYRVVDGELAKREMSF